MPPSGNSTAENDVRSRSDRIRAFRAAQKKPKEERDLKRDQRARGVQTAVHLLSAEEAKTLFSDVASGLAFLVRVSMTISLFCTDSYETTSMIDLFFISTLSPEMSY